MRENVKKFYEEMKKNEELKAKISALPDTDKTAEKFAEIANEFGFTLTVADFKFVTGELSADDLDNVAGGVGGLRALSKCPKCGYLVSEGDVCGVCNPNYYRCKVCNATFRNSDSLMAHVLETGHFIIVE